MEERLHSTGKLVVGTLMVEFTTMKYNGSRSMEEHIIEMADIATRVETLGLAVDESSLLQFVLESPSPEYGPLR